MTGYEKLKVKVEDRNSKERLFGLHLKELTLKNKLDSLILMSIGAGEESFEALPHLTELQKRIIKDYKLFKEEVEKWHIVYQPIETHLK